jgi:hypothetical protein
MAAPWHTPAQKINTVAPNHKGPPSSDLTRPRPLSNGKHKTCKFICTVHATDYRWPEKQKADWLGKFKTPPGDQLCVCVCVCVHMDTPEACVAFKMLNSVTGSIVYMYLDASMNFFYWFEINQVRSLNIFSNSIFSVKNLKLWNYLVDVKQKSSPFN